MKTLKFAPHLVPLVLSVEKISIWRLFDEKNLTDGDKLIKKTRSAPITEVRGAPSAKVAFGEVLPVELLKAVQPKNERRGAGGISHVASKRVRQHGAA